MKKCRTLNGLLKAIEKKENCCLTYTSKSQNLHSDDWIIYQENGTNLIVSDETYNQIEPFLKKVD